MVCVFKTCPLTHTSITLEILLTLLLESHRQIAAVSRTIILSYSVTGLPFTCHFNATCINIPGTYECECSSGFVGNGTHCTGNIATHTYDINTFIAFCNKATWFEFRNKRMWLATLPPWWNLFRRNQSILMWLSYWPQRRFMRTR